MSHEFPLVSVIMPVYNAASFLVDSIESILNQSYQNFELIIVDDCSSDNSLEIIYHYQKKDSRIIVYAFSEKQNLPIVRNKAISISTGKYLLNLDADDITLPLRIEKQVLKMEQNPILSIVGSDIIYFGISDKQWLTKHTHNAIITQLLFENPIPNSSCMIRKTTLINNKIIYDEKFLVAEDYDFWFRLSKIAIFENDNEILTRIRKQSNNISNNKILIQENTSLIQQKILKENLNIDANKDELALHYAITKPNCNFDLIKINDWLQKIYEANKIQQYYPDKELYSLLQEIWLKHFAGKIFENQNNYTIFIHSTLSPYQNYSFFQKIKIFIKYYWLRFGSKILF